MPIPILMPALSPTMEEGTLAKWLVKEGDSVAPGDVIAEIETDKATMEVEAVDEGKIGRIMIAEGAGGVAVNTPIALLLEDGEDEAELADFSLDPSEAVPTGGSAAQSVGDAPAASAPTAAASGPAAANGSAALPSSDTGRVFSSPLARRLAKQNAIDISVVAGTGPHGRVVKRDIERALSEGVAASASPAAPGGATAVAEVAPAGTATVQMGLRDDQILALFDEGSFEIVPHDNMRRTIAARLVESKATIPHFYLSIDCRLDELLEARKRMNARAPKDGPGAFKLSVNDFIIKALGLALREVPDANAVWTNQGTLRYSKCDVGVAVAVEGGLFTPILRNVDLLTLKEVSDQMKDLAARARKRRLAPHEYQGGTTSISNLGMYGIKRFDAVINPPHATILSIGQGEQRPIVVDGKVEIANVMSCTLSCDHRVVDGALGAQLLGAFKSFIEDPIAMLV